jgi:hypothetical protein
MTGTGRPMAERHEFTTSRGDQVAVAFDPQCPWDPDVFGTYTEEDVLIELLRVVAERDRLVGFAVLVEQIALALKCLPSSFPDATGHILERARGLVAERDLAWAYRAAQRKLADDRALGTRELLDNYREHLWCAYAATDDAEKEGNFRCASGGEEMLIDEMVTLERQRDDLAAKLAAERQTVERWKALAGRQREALDKCGIVVGNVGEHGGPLYWEDTEEASQEIASLLVDPEGAAAGTEWSRLRERVAELEGAAEEEAKAHIADALEAAHATNQAAALEAQLAEAREENQRLKAKLTPRRIKPPPPKFTAEEIESLRKQAVEMGLLPEPGELE